MTYYRGAEFAVHARDDGLVEIVCTHGGEQIANWNHTADEAESMGHQLIDKAKIARTMAEGMNRC
jgi:hypothetical protein